MSKFWSGMLFVALALAFMPGAATADDPGELAFNGACGTCHTLRNDDNRLGPYLSGIIGRKAGGADKYAGYSSSMQQSDFVWDEATLDKFIANPESVVPNNNMKPFAGLPDADQRAKIIGFLKACNQCGPECPAPKKCQPR